MLVKLFIWLEISTKSWCLVLGLEELVTSERGVSVSFGTAIFCRASIVAEVGAFSPKMALSGGLEGRLDVSFGVSRPEGVGVLDRPDHLSGDRFSISNPGVRGALSGDFSGEDVRSSVLNVSV